MQAAADRPGVTGKGAQVNIAFAFDARDVRRVVARCSAIAVCVTLRRSLYVALAERARTQLVTADGQLLAPSGSDETRDRSRSGRMMCTYM